MITDTAQQVPVVFAANFSLGITVMKRILSEIAPILEDSFDMEVIEKHHNKKLMLPAEQRRCWFPRLTAGAIMRKLMEEKGIADAEKKSEFMPFAAVRLPESMM